MKPFNCSSPFARILHWNTISIIATALFVKYKNWSTCSVKKVKCKVTVQSIFAVESLSRHIDSGDHALKSLKWLKIDYSATSSMRGSAASLYTITYKHFCKIFDVIQTSIWLSFAANPIMCACPLQQRCPLNRNHTVLFDQRKTCLYFQARNSDRLIPVVFHLLGCFLLLGVMIPGVPLNFFQENRAEKLWIYLSIFH